jgi:hypothetical protein
MAGCGRTKTFKNGSKKARFDAFLPLFGARSGVISGATRDWVAMWAFLLPILVYLGSS